MVSSLLYTFSSVLVWSTVLASATVGPGSQAQAQAPLNGPFYRAPEIEESVPDLYELLDITIVASVDGKLHALNRTSGHILWSMSSFATTTSLSAPTSLSPLVRTMNPHYTLDIGDDNNPEKFQQETYVIEPQSGDIYILHSPSAPLQRFPFSMSELIDISPFAFANKGDTKVFFGKKETSLLLIELETGKIKSTFKRKCPFVPGESYEPEEGRPPMSTPTDIYIRRTDYHISIRRSPRPGKPTAPAQELFFSTYGPQSSDNELQSMYHLTHDNIYIQPLSKGKIIAFRMKNNETNGGKERVAGAFWSQPFNTPIVAIFDVFRPRSPSGVPSYHHSPHPFVLLQPRLKLQDIFPNIDARNSYREQVLPNVSFAYVGIVEETGSLFVLSPDKYPLVMFDSNKKHGLTAADETAGGALKGKSGSFTDLDAHRDNDSAQEESDLELVPCVLSPCNVRCMVGIRPLDDGDGSERS